MLPRPLSAFSLAGTLLAAAAFAACSGAEDTGPLQVITSDAAPPPAPTPPPAEPDAAAPAPPAAPTAEGHPDPFEVLPRHAEQLKILCERGGADTVSLAFCKKAKAPELRGLADLLATLGLTIDPAKGNGVGGNPAFALNGHSSSLVVRTVSAANPRAVVFTPPLATGPNPRYVAVGYTRGEQLVEIATRDPESGEPAFYLVHYEQPCNATNSCTTADLYGPGAETGWTNYTLYEDEDLKNTTRDCLRCHQPDAKGKAFLRMQERRAPFTHWMSTEHAGGRALLADLHAVHGYGEGFGGIPAGLLDASAPALLARFVDQNNGAATPQPNAFDAAAIEAEVRASSPYQPTLNDPPGESATWRGIFDVAARGDAIRVPYHDVKVTAPDKLDAYARDYRAFLAGGPPPPNTPRTLFLDAAEEGMGFRPRKGADGAAILVQMCGECHNKRLDRDVSRARFDVTDLAAIPASEKQAALARLRLPASNRMHMPPALFGDLSAEELAKVEEVLRR